MVFDFLLDYMHLVCPSVMKKLLLHWIRSPLSTRLSNTRINFISNRFIATAFEFFPRVCKEAKVFTWYRQMESYRIPPISIVHWPRSIKGHKELNRLLRLSKVRWKPSSRTKPCSIWWKNIEVTKGDQYNYFTYVWMKLIFLYFFQVPSTF